ncbi:diacylglycerol kinase family protein [Jeotgalibacillus sp. ET6]|uniref:diacylglycerol kinase n=1 Tax=Jeotgalibacillus sp. ET6 TaxID=3037260 RepID=UPI002418419A|nr:diacylglycerol kinase family protein [Jeotgalibacillus sp. ET6]MDG5470848.1 diacylglycerol kinase family protein [Jeotgalibacillus sp. ET6]
MNLKRLVSSFRYAWDGVKDVAKHEQNFKIHLLSAGAVALAGWYLQISVVEWLFILFAVTGVLAMELMNTAVERAVDLITSDPHPLAKKAKDASAAAVFVCAAGAGVSGSIIFLPKIFTIFF